VAGFTTGDGSFYLVIRPSVASQQARALACAKY